MKGQDRNANEKAKERKAKERKGQEMGGEQNGTEEKRSGREQEKEKAHGFHLICPSPCRLNSGRRREHRYATSSRKQVA